MTVKTKASIDLVRVDDGREGIPGKPGSDGKTPYLHIAYANSADGTAGFSVSDSTNKSYMGQYTDFISMDSIDPSKYKWTKVKGSDGTNGVGISSIEDQYYQSSSNTQLIGGSWLSAYPAWVDGKYLWTRYHITYTNGMTEQTAPVCMTGPQGNAGVDGIGISDVDVIYAKSSSNSNPPTSGWQTVAPQWEDGKYIWSKTIVKYTNGSSVESAPVCISGSKGENGTPGTPGINGKMLYGTCSTSATTAAKVATVDGFSPYPGVTVSIKFTNPNTATSPTLNVNGSGPKPILVNGINYAYWDRGASVNFVYDGTNWNTCSIPVYANSATIGNPVGGNVHVDGDSIDIRNGSNVLSTFSNSLIELGKDSINSVLKACDGALNISANRNGNDVDVNIESISSAFMANSSTLCLASRADGPDAEIFIRGQDNMSTSNPVGNRYGGIYINATELYMNPGERNIPLHDRQGDLSLVSVKAKDAAMPPRWVTRCGWLQLQGRIISVKAESVICDLNGLVDPLDIPPSGVNRNFSCFAITVNNAYSTNVFLNSSGELVAAEAASLIDLSTIMFRAK